MIHMLEFFGMMIFWVIVIISFILLLQGEVVYYITVPAFIISMTVSIILSVLVYGQPESTVVTIEAPPVTITVTPIYKTVTPTVTVYATPTEEK